VAPAIRSAFAKLIRPPEHGRHGAHDEKHRRVSRIAEGFSREFDSVRADHPFVHPHPGFDAHSCLSRDGFCFGSTMAAIANGEL
jgi:hypothetical protein